MLSHRRFILPGLLVLSVMIACGGTLKNETAMDACATLVTALIEGDRATIQRINHAEANWPTNLLMEQVSPVFQKIGKKGLRLEPIYDQSVMVSFVNFIGPDADAKRKAAKIEIDQLYQTLMLYKLEVGRFPTTQEGLRALIKAPAGVANWNGPYWKKGALPKDPWGSEYKYVSPGRNGEFDIINESDPFQKSVWRFDFLKEKDGYFFVRLS